MAAFYLHNHGFNFTGIIVEEADVAVNADVEDMQTACERWLLGNATPENALRASQRRLAAAPLARGDDRVPSAQQQRAAAARCKAQSGSRGLDMPRRMDAERAFKGSPGASTSGGGTFYVS